MTADTGLYLLVAAAVWAGPRTPPEDVIKPAATLLSYGAWAVTIAAVIGLFALAARWLSTTHDQQAYPAGDVGRMLVWAAGLVLGAAAGPLVNWISP